MPKPASVCRNKDESPLNWLSLKQSVLSKFCDATSPGWTHPLSVPCGCLTWAVQSREYRSSSSSSSSQLHVWFHLVLLLFVRQQNLEAVGQAVWRSPWELHLLLPVWTNSPSTAPLPHCWWHLGRRSSNFSSSKCSQAFTHRALCAHSYQITCIAKEFQEERITRKCPNAAKTTINLG